MARVAFRQVSKYFDAAIPALRQFSLSIDDGEFVVLVGPSGCGKSTALRLLAGLETVSTGEILIDDQIVNDTSPQLRNVAMVFQNYALYPHMTVYDNLVFPLKMARIAAVARDEQVRRIAALLDLTELLARRPKQLSGGQRQRVAMGRALVRDPSVFLLDEPLSNLDAKLRAQIRADIARLQRELGKTTLYVTHDQVEAMTLGHRVAVMNQGELQQIGTPAALYARPRNTFVARFIGSPGMNILPLQLTSAVDGQVTLTLGRQSITLSAAQCQAGHKVLNYNGQALLAGLRPEAFHPAPRPHGVGLSIRIVAVEYLGHESLVYFHLPTDDERDQEHELVARIPGQFHKPTDSDAVFFIDPAAIYLFANDGLVITA